MKLSVDISTCTHLNIMLLTDEIRTVAGACVLALWTSLGATGLRGSISNVIADPVVASALQNTKVSHLRNYSENLCLPRRYGKVLTNVQPHE